MSDRYMDIALKEAYDGIESGDGGPFGMGKSRAKMLTGACLSAATVVSASSPSDARSNRRWG